jgi:hypothetical protein
VSTEARTVGPVRDLPPAADGQEPCRGSLRRRGGSCSELDASDDPILVYVQAKCSPQRPLVLDLRSPRNGLAGASDSAEDVAVDPLDPPRESAQDWVRAGLGHESASVRALPGHVAEEDALRLRWTTVVRAAGIGSMPKRSDHQRDRSDEGHDRPLDLRGPRNTRASDGR